MKTDNCKNRNVPAGSTIVATCGGFLALALLPACASMRSSENTKATTPAAPAVATASSAASSAMVAQLPQTEPATKTKEALTTQTQAPVNPASVAQSYAPVAQAPAQHIPALPATQPQSSNAALPQQTSNDLELAKMRIEIMSLKEKMASVQRKLELVLKAQRSGLYEPENLDAIHAAVRNAEPKKNMVPPLGSDGPIDRFETDFERRGHDHALTPESAQKIVDRALSDLAQGDFARVAQSLEGFQQRFPSHPLSNSVELALAEAYVELKSPQQALPHLRTFYLQHPNDVQLHRAKWLEARVQEQLEAPQRAAQLYREVIALSPQSDVALRSRAALERINGGTTQ